MFCCVACVSGVFDGWAPDFKLLTKKYEDEAAAHAALKEEAATLRAQLAAFAPDEVPGELLLG